MMTSILTGVKKNPLIPFFILAYALSWAVEIPLALQANGLIKELIPFSFHYLAGYGPILSAIIVTGITAGREGLQDLWSRMTRWRVRPIWWLVAISPLGIYFLVTAVIWMMQGKGMDIASMGQIDFLPPLGLAAIPLWILTFGIGEETGWRGFALPRLQKGRTALSATFLLWMFWALWHLPAFFYIYDPGIIPGMLIGLLAGAITFTWLYNSTEGSVLMVAIWHGLFNYSTACTTCKADLIAAIISTLVMIWSVVVVLIFKSATLSHESKQVIKG